MNSSSNRKDSLILPASYLVLIDNSKILLSKRHNTGFMDGYYSFVAGHVEKGESYSGTIIREAFEEAGRMVYQTNDFTGAIRHGLQSSIYIVKLQSNRGDYISKIMIE